MTRTVPPHDLRAACEECGIELCDLAEGTGLSEDTLLAFARAEIGLSAEDRLGIILVLEERSHGLPDELAPWRSNPRPSSPEERRRIKLALKAFRTLCMEYQEERDDAADLI